MTDEIVTNEANNSIDPQMYDFNGSQVRIIVDENGDILFCGKDVADSLGYSNPRDALKKRCRGVAKRYPLQTNGGIQTFSFIREGDVYRLIVGSKLESAQRFESWLFDEVVPQIRKTGSYTSKIPTTDEFLEMIMSNPRLIARSLEKMADQQEEIERQKKQLEEQKPHVELANSISVSNDLITITDLCKIICQTGVDLKVRTLFAMMKADGYLFKNENIPTKKAVDMGVLKLVEHPFLHFDGTTGINKYAKVTGKGQIFFVRKYGSSADQRLIER